MNRKDLHISSVKHTPHGVEVHGYNKNQEFIEYYTQNGKFKGMILRLLQERFWQVWNSDRQVVTEPIPNKGGTVHTIGSRQKKRALQLLYDRMRTWTPKELK